MPSSISRADELTSLVGRSLGPSDWWTVTQAQIDAFAAATGDRQWIHCDPERARRESPYGGTIAHGFLTLSLLPALLEQLLVFPTARLLVNYGLNRVRFPAAVPAEARLRLQLELSQSTPRGDAHELVLLCQAEIESHPKPACVAELVLRVYF